MVETIIPILWIKYFEKLRPKRYKALCKNCFRISKMVKSQSLKWRVFQLLGNIK